jgi:transposase-like protein
MDTSAERALTDKLGRRSGPRRKYTVAEKCAIVEETLQRGASVSDVAQRHGVNANLLFGWRRLYQQGALREGKVATPVALLPVKIETPTLTPGKAEAAKAPDVPERTQGSMEIEFAGGQRLRICGRVDQGTLRRVIAVLSQR